MSGGGFRLRVARQEDAAAVTAVLESAYRGPMAADYDAAVLAAVLPAMAVANARLLASGTYHVQEVRGVGVVACGGWTREAPGPGAIEDGVAHVRHFGTHADWTGQGLGRGIFEACRQEARAAGVRTLRCFSSLGAEAFYASLGFRVVQRTEVAIGHGVRFPAVAMVLING